MENLKNIAALIGLVGAVNNNGKTENTDNIVREALSSVDSDEIINRIHEEKYIISPNCRNCTSPCGNTSDYDLDKLNNNTLEIKQLKFKVIDELVNVMNKVSGEIPDVVYKAISYLGYDMVPESYIKLIDELVQCS